MDHIKIENQLGLLHYEHSGYACFDFVIISS